MRSVSRLTPAEADRLAAAPFSYAPVGATATSTHPPGFHSLDVTADVGRGADDFARAVETLMTWRMHAGAGLRVAASWPRVEEGGVVRCRLGPLRIPCRVVWVVDEPGRTGFGYGTLRGHPEAGEEAFVVTLGDDDVVRLRVSAYSRPALAVTRLAGPVGRWGQRVVLGRYARGLRN